jgi:hypothetical protein
VADGVDGPDLVGDFPDGGGGDNRQTKDFCGFGTPTAPF